MEKSGIAVWSCLSGSASYSGDDILMKTLQLAMHEYRVMANAADQI